MDWHAFGDGKLSQDVLSGWCGSNSKISLWDTSISNLCPNCGMVKEMSKHMTQCKHEGRVTLLIELICDVVACLEAANVDIESITMIETYLVGRGTRSMESCLPPYGHYRSLSLLQDCLGWDHFMEG